MKWLQRMDWNILTEAKWIFKLFKLLILSWIFCKGWNTSRHSITNLQHLRSQTSFYNLFHIFIIFSVSQGFENSNARALVVKGINVLLTLLQVSSPPSHKRLVLKHQMKKTIITSLSKKREKICKFPGCPAPPCNVCSNPETLPSNSHQGCHHGIHPSYFSIPARFQKNEERRNAKSRHPGVAGDGAGARDPPVDRDQGVFLAGDSQLLYFQAWSSGYFFLLQFATKMKNEKKSKVDL